VEAVVVVAVFLVLATTAALTAGYRSGHIIPDWFPVSLGGGFGRPPTERTIPVDPLRELAELEQLSFASLRARLRVKIDRLDPGGSRSPLGRLVSPGYEARVVLLGLSDAGPGSGIPSSLRARLPIDDHALFDLALDESIPAELPVVTQAPGPARLWQVPGWIWLCVPDIVFGDQPALIVAGGHGLVWAEVDRHNVEQDLAGLCGLSVRGPLPLALWTWDGATLAEATMTRTQQEIASGLVESNYVVGLPPSWADATGIDPVVVTRW
jgi:hypothetical protein